MERFEFKSDGSTLIGHLYLPGGAPDGVVVMTGPLTSVKEQATGAYAKALATQGFAALSFDHRHFGESEGAPRQYENPDQKIADIHAATEALTARFGDVPVHALGVCAGAGYMATAVAQSDHIASFAGVAGFYHDAAQSREWMGEGYDAAIAAGAREREAFETTGQAAMIPAVAKDGDRAMPMDEAFEFYGTARGGEETFANYRNAFAVMSREKTTGYDAQSAASQMSQPFHMIHSETALVPMLARRFYDAVGSAKSQSWVKSEGQIDFYDDPALIQPATAEIAAFYRGV